MHDGGGLVRDGSRGRRRTAEDLHTLSVRLVDLRSLLAARELRAGRGAVIFDGLTADRAWRARRGPRDEVHVAAVADRLARSRGLLRAAEELHLGLPLIERIEGLAWLIVPAVIAYWAVRD